MSAVSSSSQLRLLPQSALVTTGDVDHADWNYKPLVGWVQRLRFKLIRKLLAKSPRPLAVLNLAAEKGGWGKPLPAGRARGVAVVNNIGSFNAQVAEISVEQGKVKAYRTRLLLSFKYGS